MLEFFEAALSYGFLFNALLTGVLAGVACGIVGTFVVARRITYIAGSVAHCVLGGMGLARYLEVVAGWTWVNPLHGAAAAALLAAFTIAFVTLHSKEREDTVISAIWAIGMAVGVVFIAATPGYNVDLMSYLFGNILMVGVQDLYLIAVLDFVVLLTVILFYNKLAAVCFDEEFARIRGINVEFIYVLLLCLTALTVVILVTVVGIVMVIALLTVPAAVAGLFTRNLGQNILLAIVLSVAFTVFGLALSYTPDLPAGATIILLAGGTYLLATLGSRFFRSYR